MSDGDRILTDLWMIAHRASENLLAHYSKVGEAGESSAEEILTVARRDSEHQIARLLVDMEASIPVLTEENFEKVFSLTNLNLEKPFWIVQGLDGAHGFCNKTGEFTVNISLIANGLPVIGLVSAPALGQVYGGIVNGFALASYNGGTPAGIAPRPVPAEGGTLLVDHGLSGKEEAIQHLAEKSGIAIASREEVGSSLKFCLVASGKADILVSPDLSFEWETAAGHAVLMSAGGSAFTASGKPLTYGKIGYQNSGFYAIGSAAD